MVTTATVHSFDTLAHARRLKEAGFDEAQAEAAVAMVRDAVTESVATGADLDAAVADLKADVARIEDKMATKADRADIYRAMFGLAVFNVAVAAVAIGLM